MILKNTLLGSRFISATVLLACIVGPIQAENKLSVEQRLGRLENLMSSQVLMEQSQRLDQIQQELSSLRGMLETQENQLNLIKQRQRNLYQDIDRRLNDLEAKCVVVSDNGATAPFADSMPAESSIAPPSASAENPQNAPETTATPLPDTADKDGKSAYTMAFNTLKEGRYRQAIKEFKTFQQSYPESAYSDNAQYWLGEAYSVSGDYKTALAAFKTVVSDHPDSNKVEGAMLKIGYTYYEMREWAAAKEALDLVIAKYPGTAVSRRAKERLQRMKREGR